MTKILLACLLIGVIATALAWKVESVKVRLIIGIVVAEAGLRICTTG